MDISTIRDVIELNYNIHAERIEKIKNVYKISSCTDTFCLKVINYDRGHFIFIVSAIEHLQNKGFRNVPGIIKTAGGKRYIKIEDRFAYLTLWINSRNADYNSKADISLAASKLADLHNKSLGFRLTDEMNPRIGWFKWPETFGTRQNEILDFKEKILKKDRKTEFDNMYIQRMDDEIEKCVSSRKNLMESYYLNKMKKEIVGNGFCHHDYANHNILITKENEVHVIDFDYCMLDTHLHDLGSLLIRVMKHGRWSMGRAVFVLDAYNAVNRVYKNDIPIIASFIEFPQDYWQIGIQYYWEKKTWSEDTFIRKLEKLFDDEEQRQEFVDEFRLKNYR